MKTRRERMEGSIAWMARNPVAANLVMFGLIICGILMAVFTLRKEVFPRMEPDIVQVSVPYPGASPAEVEKGILRSVEEVVRPVDGVKEVTSMAFEGFGRVTAELEANTDKSKTLSDVKNAIDRITTFPQDAERPIVAAPVYREEAIWLVLYGDADPLVLRKIAERAREQLLEMDEISYITLSGQEDLEIAVEIPQNTLRKHGITLSQVAQRVRQTAAEIPAGGVKTKGGEILLRTAERRNVGEEFKDIPIVTSSQGNSVNLGDIASINDGFRESDVLVSFEGKNVIWLRVYSVGDQSPPSVAEATKKFVEVLKPTLPPGVIAATWLDNAEMYTERLDLLKRNAGLGLILVLVILGLFLDPRVSFWVTLGIPVAFLGSFVFLPAMGVSLNMISMFAFIIVLGMVVDDAIVVGENIYRLRKEGVPVLDAAVRGAKQVAMPVFFSVATTIAAFSPFLFIPGAVRDIVFAIPAVVIVVLSLSLVESFFILPAHLAHKKKDGSKVRIGFVAGMLTVLSWIFFPITFLLRLFLRVQKVVSGALERFIKNIYGPFIEKTLKRRWITVAFWFAILLVSFGIPAGGHVKSTFMPEEEGDWIVVNAKLPFGVPVEETIRLKDRFISAVHRLFKKHGEHINDGVLSLVADDGSHDLIIWCTLIPGNERDISTKEFADQWREEVGDIAGIQSLSFNSSISNNSKPIDIQLSHSDTVVLEEASADLADFLKGFKGVRDVENGVEHGKAQLDFTLSQEGIAAGFTTANVATQVRSAFYGYEALRQQRGRDEIRVMVRLPRSERESMGSIEDLILLTPSGAEMPLRQVANVKKGQAYSSIRRMDGKRILRVKADVVEGEANPGEVMMAVNSDFMPKLMKKYPGLTQARAGSQKSEEEFMQFLAFGFMLALFGMYGLIAIPLRSYLQPIFVVMIAIPFGFVGAILGHLMLGLELCLFSWIGLAALAGVVVNDSIVFTDAANRYRKEGMSPFEAAKAAATQRFRPIMLTSLTTFGGLTPMIFETSLQAKMMVPMAVSLGFGVLMSTVVILTLVPSMFLIIENFRIWPARRREKLLSRQAKLVEAGLATGLFVLAIMITTVPSNAMAQETDPVGPPVPELVEPNKPELADYEDPELRGITEGRTLTFEEAIKLADERNVSIHVARTEIESARADLSRSRGLLFPDVYGTVTLTHLDEEILGFQEQDTVDGRLNVSVPIISPYSWAGVSLAKDSQRVSEISVESVRQSLLLTVAQAYYQALTAKTIIAVNEEQIRSSSKHMEVAKTRLLSGVGKTLDVIRAKSDLVRLREQLLSAHTAFDNARDNLGVLTGIGGLPVPAESDEMKVAIGDEKELIDTGLSNREDIKLKKALEEMTDTQRTLNWMQFLPSLNFSWQLTRQFTEPVVNPNDRTSWTAFLVLSVPIYNQTRYADLDKSRVAIKKAELESTDTEQKAILQIRQSRRNYETAIQKVGTADTQAKLARQTLMLTETEYVSGTGSSLEVTDARRSSNEAEINLATRRFEAQISLLNLLRSAGRDMATL